MKLKKKEFVEQLTQLVAFRSLSGNLAENSQLLDYITTLIDPQAKITRLKNGQAEILIASNTKSKTPQIGYLVHADVVAGSDQLFTLQQQGAVVRGRGVSDMKFSIPIGIALLNELLTKKNAPSFALAITTDEEVGGFEGAGFLAQKFEWRPEVLIVPDGGDNLRFVQAAKGVAQFTITAFGKSAHASQTWKGENAIPKIAQLVNRLEKKYSRNNSAESWKTTLNFGIIQGGISANQVCDQATLQIDFRYPETTSFERLEQEILSLVKDIDGTMQVETVSTGLPTYTDENLPVVQEFLAVFRDEFQTDIPVQPTHGASDARHFAPFNTPVLMIKPRGGDIHMESEWLDVDSTLQFYEALRKFILGKEQL